MTKIAIIPARGGSKRIPKKNIKYFLGKPIIAYSIEAALKSNLFDEVIVSTDSEEIAEIAKQFGAKIPFLRSEKNSDDFATTFDVIEEVLDWYSINDKNIADYQIVGIVIDSEYIEKFRAIDELEKKNHRDEEYYNLKLEQKIVKIKAIEEAMRRYKIKTGLSFHRTIEDSKYFANNYKGSNIDINHVDGTMNHKLRAEILKNLIGKIII